MRLIIAGSRSITDMLRLQNAIYKHNLFATTVLCGMAKGVDLLGREWARSKSIPVEEYPAEWDVYGKAAGFIRNIKMAQNADTLLLIWDGYSKGSGHMLDTARKYKLKVYVE